MTNDLKDKGGRFVPLSISRHGGNLRQLAEQSGIGKEKIIDFSANINPLGAPEYLRSEISANISSLLHYPDPDYCEFIAAITERFSLSQEQVIVGNGSTEIIYALARALPVRRAVIPSPSYIGYQEAMATSAVTVHHMPLLEKEHFTLNWQRLEQELTAGDLVFLGQPNNPTGQLFELEKLIACASSLPDTFFVIDEAFADFIPEYHSALSLVGSQHANIIVLRSMTKFYGVPGLRLGFAAASELVAQRIVAQIPPWSVNTLSAAVGARVLADLHYGNYSRIYVEKMRMQLFEGLQKIKGLTVFNGTANFLLVKITSVAQSADDVAAKLLKKGIAVRQCANFSGLDNNFLRLAVRTAHENELLLGALSFALERGSLKKHSSPKKPALMFQGTCSDAGKSIMTAALCRILLQDGLRIAPFKSQNMSLNSFVTNDGKEMGRAQVVQAQACRLEPDVRMNPILLKPSSEVGSQVIVNGKSRGNMTVDEYVLFKPAAFKAAQTAYDNLASEYDAVILEGAGSPAEVNLKSHDIVNMRMARYAASPVVLVGDIDRGGIFASFIGSMEVMAEWERQLVAGFLVNRFRGQESLLDPALDYTLRYTGKPVLGVVPFVRDLGLPEEDSVSFKKGLFNQYPPEVDHVEVVLVDLPHISNFTDFEPFLTEPDVFFRVVKDPDDLGMPDLLILPGSKNVIHDLRYLQDCSMAGAIRQLADRGNTEIIGICGGFQMLGREIADPHHIEAGSSIKGLDLLPIATILKKDKTLIRRIFSHIVSGCEVYGYEIHHGHTPLAGEPILQAVDGLNPDVAAGSELIWGTYLHGIFDADTFRHWLLDSLRQRRGLAAFAGVRKVYDLEPAFERLATTVRSHLDMDVIYQLLGL